MSSLMGIIMLPMAFEYKYILVFPRDLLIFMCRATLMLLKKKLQPK